MKRYFLSEFKGGWFCGAFSPSLHKSQAFEVAVKSFAAGDSEPPHYQEVATEITCVLSGVVRIGGEVFRSGEICEIPPREIAGFLSLEDSLLVVVKWPSLPEDKVVAE